MNKYTITEALDKKCFGCRYCEQGSHSSFCSHPEQTKKDYLSYVYPPSFVCDLHEDGRSKSREEYSKDPEGFMKKLFK